MTIVNNVLVKNAQNRRVFDPTKREDLLELRFFINTNTWKNGCPFFLEDPYQEIPAMCKDKYVKHHLPRW